MKIKLDDPWEFKILDNVSISPIGTIYKSNINPIGFIVEIAQNYFGDKYLGRYARIKLTNKLFNLALGDTAKFNLDINYDNKVR